MRVYTGCTRLLLGVVLVILSLGLLPGATQANTRNAAATAEHTTDSPHLVIASGGHQALITELLFNANGSELISISHDKTVCVWNVSPDGRQATSTRTIRGELGGRP